MHVEPKEPQKGDLEQGRNSTFIRKATGSENGDTETTAMMANKLKKPGGTACQQQSWNAQRPLYYTHTKVLTFYMCLFIFALVVGIVSLVAASQAQEVTVRYDNLSDCISNEISWSETQTDSTEGNKQCTVEVTLSEDMAAPVYLYYELTNVYQAHKRYVSSVFNNQLRGKEPTTFDGEIEGCSDASLYETEHTTDYRLLATTQGEYLNPCGHVAASFFNDTFAMKVGPSFTTSVSAKTTGYEFNSMPTPYGIAWPTDRDDRFRRSDNQWTNSLALLENGVDDERFAVWMRTAPQPTFRKLYLEITEDLSAGTTYQFTIRNRWPARSFDGTKSLVLATTTFMGGKNWALGIFSLLVSVIGLTLFVTALFGVVLSSLLSHESDEELIERKTRAMVRKGYITDMAARWNEEHLESEKRRRPSSAISHSSSNVAPFMLPRSTIESFRRGTHVEH